MSKPKRASTSPRDTSVVVDLLRRNTHLTLAQIHTLFQPDLLDAVRIGELFSSEHDVDPRRTTALELNGHDFDAVVLEVLREAGSPVAAAYLRERTGGPRWKLQGAMRRLAQAGLVARTGNGFGTRYRAIKKRSPHEKPEHQVADLAAAE